jgi:hypothetical protein
MARWPLPSLAFPALLLALVASSQAAHARYAITADGPGGVPTYQLLAQAFTIETPDCGHPVPHITEAFDNELHENVFVFHLHVQVHLDDDRCRGKDRQRTEIRGGVLSQIYASMGETVYYHWKFRLPAGFQTSPDFTHIFQIKSDAAAPIMTLTPRGTNISIDGAVGVHGTTPLAPFLATWVYVDLKVLFGTAGLIDMTIHRVSDGQLMFSYSGAADTWQGNGAGHDPKFGIYRSLNDVAALRDEDDIHFADFCFSKTSADECAEGAAPPPPSPPPADAGETNPPDAEAIETGETIETGAGGAGGPEVDVAGPPVTIDAPAGPPPSSLPPSGAAQPPSETPPTGSNVPAPGPVLGAGGCSATGTPGRQVGALALLLSVILARSRRRRRRGIGVCP